MIRPFSSAPVSESAWHYLPVTPSSWKRPRSYPPVVQRMLLPIQFKHLTDMAVTSVLDFAAKNKKDLVLLVVYEDSDYDQEVMFSSMRGLQAQAQQFGEACLSIDTAVGFNNETISCCADKHGVDVVILAGQLSDFESKEKEDFALFSTNWQPLV